MLNFTVIPIKLETDPLPITERESYCGDDIYYKPSSELWIEGEGEKGEDLFGDALESVALDGISSAIADMI